MTDGSKAVFQEPAEIYEPRGRLDPAGFERHVEFRTVPPPVDLAPFIAHFWVIRWDSAFGHFDSDELMHRPYVDVFLSAQESGIQGTFRGKRTYSAAGTGRIIGIRFRPGGFHPFWRGEMADTTEALPMPTPESFLLAGSEWPMPTYEIADDFVAELERRQLLSDDPLVNAALRGDEPAASARSVQRHVSHVTGLTSNRIRQIVRAREAAERIRRGDSILDVTHDLGYADQAHLTRDLKRLTGYTPGRTRERDESI
jgi:AraC-like DNA-binding protein